MDRPDQRRAAEIEDVGAVFAACTRFEVEQGRRPRILIATFSRQSDGAGAGGRTPGELDDGVSRELAAGFAGMGLDADVGPAASTAEQVAAQAIDADVHAICLPRCNPDRSPAADVIDGAQIFASKEAGCASCHSGRASG